MRKKDWRSNLTIPCDWSASFLGAFRGSACHGARSRFFCFIATSSGMRFHTHKKRERERETWGRSRHCWRRHFDDLKWVNYFGSSSSSSKSLLFVQKVSIFPSGFLLFQPVYLGFFVDNISFEFQFWKSLELLTLHISSFVPWFQFATVLIQRSPLAKIGGVNEQIWKWH